MEKEIYRERKKKAYVYERFYIDTSIAILHRYRYMISLLSIELRDSFVAVYFVCSKCNRELG